MRFRIRSGLEPQLSPEARNNFFRDFSGSAIFSLFNVVFNQFYLPIAIQHGASSIQVGLLSAGPAIGMILSPLWAGWIERTNPKPFFIWPNLIGRLLIILPAFFVDPWVFVTVALLFQLLMGIQAPAYAPFMTQIYPAAVRGRLMGSVRVVNGLLMIPTASLIGWWMDRSGHSGPLLLAALTGVISISLYFGMRPLEPPKPADPSRKRASLAEQWQVAKENRILAVFLVATTFSGFANFFSQPLYQIIQVEVLQLSYVQIGYARMTYFLFLILTYIVVGWAIDRYPPERTLGFGIGAYCAVPLMYSIFGNYGSVIVASGIQGIGDAIWDLGILAFVFRIAPGREAVVFGLHLLLFGIRGTIGPLLSTSLAALVSLPVLLFIAALFALVGTFLFVHRIRHLERSANQRGLSP